MIIEAKLKGDKEPRQFSFTGHNETNEAGVKALFEKTHPGSTFGKIVSPGLNRLTGQKLELTDDPTDAPAKEGAPASTIIGAQ